MRNETKEKEKLYTQQELNEILDKEIEKAYKQGEQDTVTNFLSFINALSSSNVAMESLGKLMNVLMDMNKIDVSEGYTFTFPK